MTFNRSKPNARNPYYHRNVIRDPSVFFGRKRILHDTYALIADEQSVAITGIRRIGKSSLLACMCRPEVQQRFLEFDLTKHIFVLINFAEHSQTDPSAFLAFVARQVIEECQGRMVIPTFSRHGDDIAGYKAAFTSLLEQVKDQGFRLVLLMDEFDIVTQNSNFDRDFLYFLRSEANWHRITYVTASFAPLHKLCHTGIVGSPFFNIFLEFKLGPLDAEEAHELITTPAELVGQPFTADETLLVIQLAGRHPFLIQCACFVLFADKARTLRDSASIDYIDFQQEVYDQLLRHFEDYWTHLDDSARQNILVDAHRSVVSQRAIPELSESSLFLRFVRDKLGITFDPTGITVKELDAALKKLTDFRFLGESSFAYLRAVSQRCPPSATTYERGISVATVLHEAIERLQPMGPPSHLAPEWRPFNVMHYGYVARGGMSVDDIARRLAISKRTFYRERDEALEAVLNRLAEMESLSVQSHQDG